MDICVMKVRCYNYDSAENSLYFEFQSISSTKTIQKIVVYTPIDNRSNIYNLALGDLLENGEVSDSIVSDNGDLERVIATIVQTMLDFFRKYPDCSIYFKGNTPERTRLYRIIINKEFAEATKIFQLFGIINSKITVFEPNIPFESFVIKLKS